MSSLLQNLENVLAQTVSGAASSLSKGESPMGALANMLGMGGAQQGGAPQQTQPGAPAASPFGGLLGPAALGGLAGVLLGGKGMRSMAGGALLAGGGAYLWDKYKDQIKSAYKEVTGPDTASGTGTYDTSARQGQVYDLDDSFEPIPAAPQPQVAQAPESPLAASAHAAAAQAEAPASAYASAPTAAPTSAHAAAQADAQPATSAHAAAQADAQPAASAHAAAQADAQPAASAHAAAQASGAAAPASAHAAAQADAQPAPSAHAAAQASGDAAPTSAHAAASAEEAPATAPADLARRVVTALVFAAKADGHIDDKEQQAIADKMRELNLGPQTQALVQAAMDAPLDPARIADGLADPELAMQLFMLSCSVIDVDHFMERSYLDALAEALRIPKEMKEEMQEKIKALKQEA